MTIKEDTLIEGNEHIEQLIQVDASHYNFNAYVDLPRWNSYWHQIEETIAFDPKTVLKY
jgi:hypothetical protein